MDLNLNELIEQNAQRILKDSKFFNEEYYKENNPQVTGDAISYYIKHNKEQLKAASRYFNPKWYLEKYPDVAKLKIDPLLHFLFFGREEGRNYRYVKSDFKTLNIPNKTRTRDFYDVIYESELFDITYYTTHNGDFSLDGLDPIIHYIIYGAEHGFNPSHDFNTNDYIKGKSFSEITENPLHHFIIYGHNTTDEKFINIFNKKEGLLSKKDIPLGTINDILDHLKRKVTIVIPIYNAYEETCDCIRSVLLNTDIDYELLLVNDCSSDERIKPFLDSLASIENVHVVHNINNQGFVKTANKGMDLANPNDVVLLNSDTIVTPRWLSKLIVAAYSEPSVATVTPLSSNSDISVESLGESKDQKFLNKNAYQVSKINYDSYFEAPTGNGFCLFIKRGALRKLGTFDTQFGRGYGEETDFTSRARKAGWKNIRALDVFIYHRRHASFTKENTDIYKQENKKILQERHPEVFNLWDKFAKQQRLQDILKRIDDEVTPYRNGETILYVTELTEKGKPVIKENFYRIAKEYDTHILAISKDSIGLFIYDGIFNFTEIYHANFEDIKDSEIKKIYFNMIVKLRYDLFFICQFKYFLSFEFNRQASFVKLSRLLEIPVVFENGFYYPDDDLLKVIDAKLNPIHALDDIIIDKKEQFSFKDKKVAVYTAVTGGYDDLIIPEVIDEDFDYICFTDNPELKSDFWDVRMMDDINLDRVRKARIHKIQPHRFLPEYDYTFWIDGNFKPIFSLKDYVYKYFKNNQLLAIPHEARDCIYEEAIACEKLQKDDPEVMIPQMEKYKSEGYPEHNGLIASGVLFRNNKDPQVMKVMDDWTDEVLNHSRRDQLSFNYACWKNNFNYDTSDIYYFKNQFLFREGHGDAVDKIEYIKYHKAQKDDIISKLQEPTTIIVPVYNAYEDTKKCIESVIKNTNIPYKLYIINDRSSDPRIKPMLDDYAERYENISVLHNKRNKGFVANVNIGFKHTTGDVVLLNSDTIVTPKWLMKLKTAAYTQHNIATVTPLSNNSGAFSVPEINKQNLIKSELGLNSIANIIEKLDGPLIETPTANGFCMFIRRSVIRDLGDFDLNFGRGYCEENDFSMRAIDAGWKNVIDTKTFIYHNESASFTNEKQTLLKTNKEYLRRKHPTYKKRVTEFLNDPEYKKIREKIVEALASTNADEHDKKNILYVIHEGKGGTLHTTIDLMQHISKKYNTYILTASRSHIYLYTYLPSPNYNMGIDVDKEFKQNLKPVIQWRILGKYTVEEFSIDRFEHIYYNVLQQLNIDIVHIRHLVRHTFDMPRVAHIMGLKVILSFHDFYFVCPSHNLLDENIKYCGGECTPIVSEDPKVSQCQVMLGIGVKLAKKFLPTWREYVSEMFEFCDEFITTSKSTYDIYTRIYPKLRDKPFHIIEHGRDLSTPDVIDVDFKISDEKPIRILIPGNINLSKGAKFIKELKSLDKNNHLELHFMGDVYGQYDFNKMGVVHSPYNRSEFTDMVRKINPHFIGIFSIWPETYCHTLTEAWSSGVPVIGIDLGAVGERIKKNGGGFLLSQDPKEVYAQILSISEDDVEYEKEAKAVANITFKSTKQMAQDYMEIYDKNEKQTILFIQHETNDPILYTSSDLMEGVSDKYNIYILSSTEDTMSLYKYNQLQPDLIDLEVKYEYMKNYQFIESWNVSDDEYNAKKFKITHKILENIGVDIIHIEHIKNNMFELPQLAYDMNIKVVLSLHDLYYISPDSELIDINLLVSRDPSVVVETPQQLESWYEEVSEMFKYVDEFIADSEMLAKSYHRIYPQIADKAFKIIEPGRIDIWTPDKIRLDYNITVEDPIKILIPANKEYDNNLEFIKEIKKLDIDNHLEFHFLGLDEDDYDFYDLGIAYGEFKRSEFIDAASMIEPHLFGIFTTAPEATTFIDDAWSYGRPIVAPDIGKAGEYIRKNGGGFLFNNTPKEAYERILSLTKNHLKYTKACHDIEDLKIRETNEMSNEYLKVYKNNLDKNILYVMHNASGGVLHHVLDILPEVTRKYNMFLLSSTRYDTTLYKYNNNINEVDIDDEDSFGEIFTDLITWEHDHPYTVVHESIKQFDKIYQYVLKEYHIDLIHIEHMIHHTCDLPRIAKERGIKIILSMHDFFYICPAHNLLDENGNFCEGECTPKTSDDPVNHNCKMVKGLKCPLAKDFVSKWQERMSRMFELISEFIAPSESTYNLYCKIYPELKEKQFDVIEHGHNLTTPDVIDVDFNIDEKDKVTILLPGNIGVSKGAAFIKKLKEADKADRLDLHIMGKYDKNYELDEFTTIHPPYKRGDFQELVAEIDPDFIGIFSTCAETHCYTLTEAWSCGVPVLALNLGAQAERIKEHGGGFLLSSNPDVAYNQIITITKNNDKYVEVRKQIEDIGIVSIESMKESYMKIYDKYLI